MREGPQAKKVKLQWESKKVNWPLYVKASQVIGVGSDTGINLVHFVALCDHLRVLQCWLDGTGKVIVVDLKENEQTLYTFIDRR